jgi:hypothetical protein
MFITVGTIGYGAVIDLGSRPWGRMFIIGAATSVSGVGLKTSKPEGGTGLRPEGRGRGTTAAATLSR